jgi:hypothetical protein
MRQDKRIGTDQPDDIRQHQYDNHQEREQRIERHQHAPAARGCERKSGDQRQQADRGGDRQQQQAGFDGPGEPRIAPVLADELPGMQQQQGPQRPRQHQGTELDTGRTECQHRHGQENRKHRMLSADDGARQQVQCPERRDRAKLRQQINAENVIARGTKREIGEPERQRRAEIGSDLVFPAIGEHGGEVARRAAIQQHRNQQPERRLQQHHKPDYQPRPGADQFDNQGGETHEAAGSLVKRSWLEATSLVLRSDVGVYHRAALRADPLVASRRIRDLMVRDAQDALLTMRTNASPWPG